MNSSLEPPWVLSSPLDMHLHLRQGDLLKIVAPVSATLFAGAVIMPNLVPPVTTLQMVKHYREEIAKATAGNEFAPYMTLFFGKYSYRELEEARNHIIGIKLYPEGVTTNSASGIRDWRSYEPVLKIMEELKITLLVHGETHGFVMDREREFMSIYDELACRFPKLKIVMEHISTRESILLLDRHENIFATVTVHHLLLTLDDMAGGLLQPHLFCKPILKRPEDRDAIQKAVLSGHKKLMFGSDSAPHPIHAKECCGCAAGIFSAPVAISMLADLFDRNNKRHLLQAFISQNAQQCHNLSPPRKQIELSPQPWDVPDNFGSVVPFMANVTLPWSARLIPENK